MLIVGCASYIYYMYSSYVMAMWFVLLVMYVMYVMSLVMYQQGIANRCNKSKNVILGFM